MLFKGITKMPLKHCLAWGINCLAKKPAPVFDCPHSKQISPSVQFEPLLAQLCAIPVHPTSANQGAETGASLCASPPQGEAESTKIGSWPPFLQSRQPECPQPLLTAHAFQPLYQPHCSPLDTFKDLNIFFILCAPKLCPIFKVKLNQH